MLWYGKIFKERIKLMQKFIIFFLGTFLTTFSAEAFSVKHDFFVTVGPFDASKTEFTYSLLPGSYFVNSQVSTNGFFNTVYPFKALYSTSGIIKNNQMITSDYNYTSQSRFNSRGKQVFYSSQGIPLYQISSKNGKAKKKEFAPSPTPADTFDLQTVLAKLARQYNQLGFCDSHLAVYDGKRRFDVVFKDLGTDTLLPNEHSFYSGSAAKCSMYITKLLSEDDDSLWEFSANKPVYFWIARDSKSNYPFIARVLIEDTPLGELNAYTEAINVKE